MTAEPIPRPSPRPGRWRRLAAVVVGGAVVLGLAAAWLGQPDDLERFRELHKAGISQEARFDLSSAQKSYEAALEAARGLPNSDDPNEEQVSREKFELVGRLARVQLARHDLAPATVTLRSVGQWAQGRAKEQPQDVYWQTALASHLHDDGCLRQIRGNWATAMDSFERSRAIAIAHQGADAAPYPLRRLLGAVHARLGALQELRGLLDGALTSYEASLAAWREVPAAEPDSRAVLRELALALGRVGHLRHVRGELATALAHFEASRAAWVRVVDLDPDDGLQARIDLANTRARLGMIQLALGNTGAAREHMAASKAAQANANFENRPTFDQMQRGVAEAGRSDKPQAAASNDADAANAVIEAAEKELAAGDKAGALKTLRQALDMRATAAKAAPGNDQRLADLADSHDRIALVLDDQRDYANALASFRAVQTIHLERAALDPGSTEIWSDLALVHRRIGLSLLAQGDSYGTFNNLRVGQRIALSLVVADPANMGLLSDLADHYGTFALALDIKRNLPGALEATRATLALRLRLAAAAIADRELQERLAKSYERIGKVQEEQGDAAAARASLQAAQAARVDLTGAQTSQ